MFLTSLLVLLFCSLAPGIKCLSNKTCPSDGCLYYTDKTAIRRIDLLSNSITTSLNNLREPTAMACDVKRKLLIWVDAFSDQANDVYKIRTYNFTIDVISDVITKDLGVIFGLAVDWETGLMYWTDFWKETISVATYDGKRRKTLITGGVVNPHGIAVDSRKGLMFWTDWGSKPRIQRATLSGHNQTTIFYLKLSGSKGSRWPQGVTIDYAADRLYWIDNHQNVIRSVDFNGNDVITHRSFFQVHAYSIDLYNRTLFISDAESMSIKAIDKQTGLKSSRYGHVEFESRHAWITVYNQDRQPSGSKACIHSNCDYMCLLTPQESICACPDGQVLNKDRKSCRDADKVLLYFRSIHQSIDAKAYQIPLDPEPQYIATLLYSIPFLATDINQMAFDPIEKQLFLFYGTSILRANLNKPPQRIVGGLLYPSSLSVDWVGRNLYWSDEDGKIEVSKLDGKYRKTIILESRYYRPLSVALNLRKGLLYWSSSSKTADLKPKIEQSNMDGTNRTLLKALEYPSHAFGLTVHNNSLYWCNISLQAINYINYINLNDPRHTIKTIFLSRDLINPSALTSLAGVLYLLSRGTFRNGSIVAIDGESGLVTSKVAWHLRDGLNSFCAVDFNVSIAAVSNACLHNNGNCSYLCLLTPFGASCACPNEMTLTADGKTCYLREFLIYVDTSIPEGIYKIPLDNIPSRPDKLPLKISQYPSHIDLDFDPIESYVYWTSDVSDYSIMRAHLNGSDQKAIISRDLTRPLGLAVDMIGRNIYWTDLDRGVIEVAKLDGSYRKVLVKNIAGPRSIVLDGIRGFMYWSSYLDHDIKPARIERSYMDATNQTLIKELSPRHHLFPYAFTIDPYVNRLYWLQFYDKNLYFTDLDDPFFHVYQYYSSNHLLVSSGLAVSEKNIYWSKGGIDAGIYRISKGSGTSSPEKLVALRGEALDVHVYHNTSMAIPASHACTVNNGHCTHLCLVIPDGYTCACPDDPSHGWPCYEVPLPPTLKPAVIHTTSTENILTSTTTVLSSSSSPSSITASTSILTLITPKTIQPSPLKLRTTFTTLTQESTSYHTLTMTTVGHPSQQPCKSNPCFHNSKCVEVNGAFKCRCQEGFASRLCNVYYGTDKITITIAVPIKMWNETLFKMAMVEMLNSFCSRNDCSFNSRTRQRRRSSSSSFETSNIVIVNGPISVPAGIQIQIAVLQSHLAHVTQTLPSHLLCRIVRDSEKNLLNGYDIVAINGEAHPKCQASPISGKTNNKHTSSFSSLVWIVIFVVVLVVMAVLSVACFYERRKRHQLLEEPCTAQQVTFHNPGYIEDSTIVNDPFSESTYENMSHNDEFFQSKQHERDLHPLVGNPLYFMTETSLTVEKPRSSHNTPGKFEACLTTEKSLVKEDSDSSCKDSVKIDNRVGIADQGNLWQENTESRQNSGDKDDCVHRYVSISPMISRRYQRTEHLYATIGDDEDGAQCVSILESPQHDKQPLKLDESIVNLYEEMNQCFKDDTVNAVPDIEVTYQDGAFSEKIPTNIPGEKRTRENVNDVIRPLTVESTLGNTTEGSRAPGEKRTHENASHVDGPLVKTASAEIKTYENIDDMEHPSVNETFGNSREHARAPEEKRTYENIDDIEGPLPIKESCRAPQQQRTYGDIKGTSSKDEDTSHSIGAPVEMSTSDDDHAVPLNNNQLECNVVKIQGIDNKDESFT